VNAELARLIKLESPYLFFAGMAVGVHLLDGEEVCGDELPGPTPVFAVGSQGDVRRAVQESVGEGGRRARGEDVVVGAHDRLRRARGRHDEVGDGTEAEEHEAAAGVLGGEVTEGDVREGADQVQVADDGKRRRGRRELLRGAAILVAGTAVAC